MAPPALHLRCKATRLALVEMTAAVSAFTRSASRFEVASLHMLRGGHMQAYASMHEVHPSVFDVPDIWTDPETPASRALATEHLLYINAFDAFITVLLQKMNRQIWADAGSGEDMAYKALWGMMFDTCTVFVLFPFQWPKHLLPDGHSIYSTLNAIMHYLVPLTCPRSGGVTAWAPPLGRAVTANETRVMIEPAWCTFINMCNSDHARLPPSLRSLPPAFVHTLCMIATKKLDASLPSRLTDEFFGRLVQTINCCVQVALPVEGSRDVVYFRTPAVVEVLRKGLSALQDAPQELMNQIRQTMEMLSRA